MVEENNSNNDELGENSSNSKDSSRIKKVGKKVVKEVAKQQATKVVGKTIEGSKIAAGGTGTPAGSIVSGVTEAGQAIKNKDAMGVADAGVKTGAVLGATALGGAAAGAVTEKILNTKIGKKTTRLTSKLLIISFLAPIVALILIMSMVGGVIGAISGFGGQQVGGLFDPCIKGSVLAITDGPTVQILTPIVKSADSVNKAVTGVMVYLSGDFNSSSNLTTSVKALYKEIETQGLFNTPHASGGGKISGGVVSSSSYNAPWEVAYYAQNPKVSKTSSPSPEQLSLEQSYAAVYSRAYWTVNTMITRDPSLGKGTAGSDQLSNYDDTISATQFLTGVAVPSCQPTGALDASGNLIDSGKPVQAFLSTETINVNITAATLTPKTHIITYNAVNNLSIGNQITISGLSQSLFDISNAVIISRTIDTFSVKDTSNTSTKLSVSGESGTGMAQGIISQLPSQYNVTAAVTRALSYNSNAPSQCSAGCYLQCEKLAEIIWGHIGVYLTAMEDWNDMVKRGFGHKGDISPPVGALLFWDNGAPDGHVAVYVGKYPDPKDNNKMKDYVISNWGSGPGGVGGVNVYKMTISVIDTGGFNYLGWSEPIFRG